MMTGILNFLVSMLLLAPISEPAHGVGEIEVAHGFEVQQVAAEPAVMDPVDFDWGPDGKLWVVEMADYPMGIDGKGTPCGRIKLLEDRDQDGIYETAALFADGLSTPNGILAWRNGVLVTACPDILYLEDTNGDQKADLIRKLYSGFGEGNEQHRINGLRWGLDNWVYLANGDSGGSILSHQTGQKLELGSFDLRIQPDTGAMEPVAGRTQYGRNRDNWGNWFGCNNPNPIFHYVLDLNYLERNPHLQPPPLRQDIRVGDSRVYPIAPIISHCDTKYRPLGAIPRFTSACGTMVYRDQLFGPEYENVTFTSEPVYNLIHARKLQPEGVTFQSLKLQEGETEFFRSKDPWSRPAGLHVGPDGALYVADMVREVIEHPEWIDDELEKTINVRSGEELGRIYRIAPTNAPRRTFKRLDTLDTAGLVKALDSPSGWQRDLVQRMLIWRNDLSAVPLLEELATNASSATTRLHALCTLEGMNALTEDLTLSLLADPHPGVRRHAIRCLEHFEYEEADPHNWNDKLKTLVHDADPFVRLQLAYSLGEFPAAWSANLLGQTLLEGQDDRNQITAALSSLHKQNLGTVFELVQQQSSHSPLAAQVAALAVQMNQADILSSWFTQFSSDPSTWKTLREWFLLLGSAKQDLWKRLGPENSSQLTALLENARQITKSQNESVSLRADAMRVLGHQPSMQKQDVELLLSLLDPLSAPQLQQTALETVLSIPNESIPQQLIAHWPRLSPTLRKILLDGLLARVSWTEQLLAAIQGDQIQASVISTEQQQLLLQHRSLPVRTQAESIFGKLESNRSPILKEYLNVVSLLDAEARNLERGQELFKKKCQSCHRLQNEGQHLGPDLTRLLNRSPEALLTAIIDPNQSVEAKYLQYQILTVEGQTWNGILKEETATSLTIALPDGKTKTIPRSDLELFQASQLSLMPVGLEKDLSLDQMADLIKYLIHQTSLEQAE